MCAPVTGRSVNPVWTDERGSVVWSNADLLAPGSALCHSHLQVQDPPGPGPGQSWMSRTNFTGVVWHLIVPFKYYSKCTTNKAISYSSKFHGLKTWSVFDFFFFKPLTVCVWRYTTFYIYYALLLVALFLSSLTDQLPLFSQAVKDPVRPLFLSCSSLLCFSLSHSFISRSENVDTFL